MKNKCPLTSEAKSKPKRGGVFRKMKEHLKKKFCKTTVETHEDAQGDAEPSANSIDGTVALINGPTVILLDDDDDYT